MKFKAFSLIFLFSALAALLAIGSCNRSDRQRKSKARNWCEIKESGVIRVITMYNPTSYFIYRNKEMGYEYSLAKQFANLHGLEMEIVTANKFEELTELLREGKGDVIAYDMPVLLRRKFLFRYCGPETVTHQVLVQRRDTSRLDRVPDLIGKTVYVERGSKYELRTQNLGKELGGKITMKYAINDTAASIDEFIDAVARGEIDYTIADNLTATLYKGVYRNIDISVNVSFEQRSAWLVMKKNSELADSIDSWVKANNLEKKYLSDMRKYFRINKFGHSRISTAGSAISLKDGIISPYDDLFKKYAATIGWDWKLLAAMAYSESKFDSTLVSWAGARGIMQLMPQTAKGFSDEGWDTDSNEHNIAAACRYIASLERSFAGRVKDKDERLKFIIASYNSGIGHVLDAIALADKYGMNPEVWNDNVGKAILMKNNPEYYNDPVCRFGVFKGVETSAYVDKVLGLYDYYRSNIKKE